LNQANQHNHHRQYQQKVNVSAQGVRTHYPEKPQYEQYHEDCPKHFVILRIWALEVVLKK